jgi:hypothetical protein
VHELRAGLWRWQTPHPDWTPGERWPQEVSSCAIDDGERLVLFDPLGVPEALLVLAREREPVIVLTAPWHERDAQTLVERLDAALFAPPSPASRSSSDCGHCSRCRSSSCSPRTGHRQSVMRSNARSPDSRRPWRAPRGFDQPVMTARAT